MHHIPTDWYTKGTDLLMIFLLIIQKDLPSHTSFISNLSCKLESPREPLKILMLRLHTPTQLNQTPQKRNPNIQVFFYSSPDDSSRVDNNWWSTSWPPLVSDSSIYASGLSKASSFLDVIIIQVFHHCLDLHFILQALTNSLIFNQNACLHITMRFSTDGSETPEVGG